ncbi:VOC family protein [Ruegeria sp. SCPT10]|uniref:VOC family protein n=1 Tax=Ruegeria sp. SCP10 TaxID=3141377 RepID=UPI003338A541
MNADNTGQIVWHDLFTPDLSASETFYGSVASWDFIKESTDEYVWGQGKGEFTLALLKGESGSGLVETPAGFDAGWLPYFEVPDVDRYAGRAEKLGARVIRSPFDVPGVGRNCLLLDPSGARFGISVSQHEYPIPTQQFAAEIYLSGGSEFPVEFYQALFDRTYSTTDGGEGAESSRWLSQSLVVASRDMKMREKCAWLPVIKVVAIEKAVRDALTLGASETRVRSLQSAQQVPRVFRDPMGLYFAFQQVDPTLTTG